METYGQRLANVANEALMVINAYDGKRAEKSVTGETIIKYKHNNVNVIIVIGGNEPIIRDCVEHRMREDSVVNKWKFLEEHSTDVFMLDEWSYEDICSLADELLENE